MKSNEVTVGTLNTFFYPFSGSGLSQFSNFVRFSDKGCIGYDSPTPFDKLRVTMVTHW